MALRECKECGLSVSTTAPACPRCGAADPTGEIKRKSNTVGMWILITTLAIFALFSVYMHYRQGQLIDEYHQIALDVIAQRDSLLSICGGRSVR